MSICFENNTNSKHIVDTIGTKMGQESKPFTLKNGELYIMG
jgi:hypothetical protein